MHTSDPYGDTRVPCPKLRGSYPELDKAQPCRTDWGKQGTRYAVTVEYYERPGHVTALFSSRPDGLYTYKGANARVNREWREAHKRGLSVQASTVRLIKGVGE